MSIGFIHSPPTTDYASNIAALFPAQGEWSADDYLNLTDGTRRRIEFTDGHLEFLPMPTEIHQELAEYLFLALREFVERNQLGKVHGAGLRLQIRPGKIREPDVLFLHKQHFHARRNRLWHKANLVMEVVSDDAKDRQRDYEQKLLDYAEAGIEEYWIVDYSRQCVMIYALEGNNYRLHGEFQSAQQAASPSLLGFTVDVTALFSVADDIPRD